MADAKKRIILYQEKTTVDNSDYVLTDSSANGTKKYQVTRILTEAEATARAKVDAEAAAREAADNELKADLSDVVDIQIALESEKRYSNIVVETGKGVQIATGNVVNFGTLTTWVVSPLYHIPYDCYKIESNFDTTRGSSAYGYAIYDVNMEYIRGAQDQSNITVQEGDAYIRFTNYSATSAHDGLYAAFAVNNALKNTLDYIIDGSSEISPVTMTSGGGIKTTDGGIADFSAYPNWTYSDFIPIPPYTTRLTSNAVSNASSVGVAFYDANKQYIADSGVGSYTGLDVTVLESYKYVRFTNNTTMQASPVFLRFTNQSIYTNPAASFAEAVASGKLLKGTYTLDSTITLNEGQTLIGSECIVNVTDSGQIRMNNGCKISGIRFVGSWNPTREAGDGTTYTQYGYVPLITYQNLYDGNSNALFGTNKTLNNAVIFIPYDNAYNTTVDNCRFENFDRLAVFGGGRRHQENTNPVICNNYFCDCRMGVYLYGEFIRCYANEYLRCIVGCYLYGGNSNNYGEIMKCCDCGYYFPSNSVAHNEITACETAHCGLAGIYVKTLSAELGCQVTGSQIVDAPVVGDTVGCLALVGCRIDTWFQYTSGSKNSIVCCNVRKGYMYSKTTQFDVPSDTQITLNRGMGVVPDSAVNWT